MRAERADLVGNQIVAAGEVALVRVISEAACSMAEILPAPSSARIEPPNVVMIARA